ncbi:MAG: DUF2169 domain-containing protein [Myxococcales bacterium]|nr:DUF2169 domain-containing protein [Myxococcales bacterium]
MDSPPHDNHTDFEVHPQVLVDRDGEVLVCIVKATFELPPMSSSLELAGEDDQRMIRMADVPWGEPEKSSILFPSDLCVRKPGTDVVVVAEAHAPNGVPVPVFDCGIRIGYLEKYVRCFGLRVWEANGSGITPPSAPIDRVEIRYDNAWGGFDDSDPENLVEEARNPVGMGCVRDLSQLTHQPAPILEDPNHPLSSVRTRPPPASLGAVGRHWEPRRSYLGTYDDAWFENRAPLPPKDQSDRMNVCASPGLWSEQPLLGGEEVALLNLIPGGGALRFFLPQASVELEFRVKGRDPVIVRPHLDTIIVDTLILEPEERPAVELVWRASVKAPRRLKDSRIIIREG